MAKKNKKPRFTKVRGSKPSMADERKYRRALLARIAEANALVMANVMPLLRADKASIAVTGATSTGKGTVSKVVAEFDKIKKAIASGDQKKAEKIAKKAVESMAKSSVTKSANTLEKVGILLPQSKDIIARQGLGNALDAITAENASLVTNMSREYIDKIQRAVLDNYLTGKFEGKGGIVKELQKISTINKKRAKLIARDQSNKIHASVTRLQAQASGSIGYEWNTVKDERVRGNPSGRYPDVKKKNNHWERQGKYYLWTEAKNPPISPDGKLFRQPPPDGMPGQAINCRCFASAVWAD